MKQAEFCNLLGEISPRHILAAEEAPEIKRPRILKWAAMAACLCLALLAAFVSLGPGRQAQGLPDAVPAPTITIGSKAYTAPDMPVEELPAGYHYLRDLTREEAGSTGLAGCAIYADPRDEDLSVIYLYQECGTPVDETTVDPDRRQWAYVPWTTVPDTDGETGG